MIGVERFGMAFEPRRLVSEPSAFGGVRELLPPAEGVAPTDHRYRAAMVQHLMATIARDEIRLAGRTLPQFLHDAGDLRGTSADRHRRIFRGETGAQYADLSFWAGHFPFIAVAAAKYIASWAPDEVIEEQARRRMPRF